MVCAISCGGRLPPPVEVGGIYQARIAEVAVFSIAGEASEDRTLLALMYVSAQRMSSDTHVAESWPMGMRPSRAAICAWRARFTSDAVKNASAGHKENRSSILVRESRYALTNLTMTSTQVVLR